MNPTPATTLETEPDLELAEAMARALAYTDDIGLSDGTDRPTDNATTALTS